MQSERGAIYTVAMLSTVAVFRGLPFECAPQSHPRDPGFTGGCGLGHALGVVAQGAVCGGGLAGGHSTSSSGKGARSCAVLMVRPSFIAFPPVLVASEIRLA